MELASIVIACVIVNFAKAQMSRLDSWSLFRVNTFRFSGPADIEKIQYVAALGMRACDGVGMGKVEADALATGITDHGQNGKEDLLVPSSVRANPLYGSGVFRRRVRLVNQPGFVCAELEDEAHGFRLHVGHDGLKVIAIAVEAL